MNAASTDPSHTMTVAATQVPMPLIDRPSVSSTVTMSDTRVAIKATPPSTGPGLRRKTLKKKGWSRAKTIVKIATDTTKPVTSRLMRSRTAAATISPTAFAANATSRRTTSRITGGRLLRCPCSDSS